MAPRLSPFSRTSSVTKPRQSGRKVELDEVTVPAPLLESSSSQKPVPVMSTPISEEANDNDHETWHGGMSWYYHAMVKKIAE